VSNGYSLNFRNPSNSTGIAEDPTQVLEEFRESERRVASLLEDLRKVLREAVER